MMQTLIQMMAVIIADLLQSQLLLLLLHLHQHLQPVAILNISQPMDKLVTMATRQDALTV